MRPRSMRKLRPPQLPGRWFIRAPAPRRHRPQSPSPPPATDAMQKICLLPSHTQPAMRHRQASEFSREPGPGGRAGGRASGRAGGRAGGRARHGQWLGGAREKKSGARAGCQARQPAETLPARASAECASLGLPLLGSMPAGYDPDILEIRLINCVWN
jgi:hypothetical protein